jgi:hypothetical protein
MKLRRAAVAVLAAMAALAGSLAIAAPAQAAVPLECDLLDYANGREVETDNNGNGGGAAVWAVLCWTSLGNGYYDTYVTYWVKDTAANGAGAAIRIEWTGTDGAVHYDVTDERAWSEGELNSGEWGRYGIKALYVRACLTNAGNEGRHCGPRS